MTTSAPYPSPSAAPAAVVQPGWLPHLPGLAIYVFGAYCGLVGYQLVGGVLRWITPFWWGRNGLNTLILAGIALAIVVAPCYAVTRRLLVRAWMSQLPARYLAAALLAASFAQGCLLWPIADWVPYFVTVLRTRGGPDFLPKVAAIFALSSVIGAMIAATLGSVTCYLAARLRGRL